MMDLFEEEGGKEEEKCCCSCKQYLPRTAFYRNASRPDGRSDQCIACQKAYKRRNRDRRRAADYKWERSGKGRWQALKQRAAEKGWPVGLTREEFFELYTKPCHYCTSLDLSGTGYRLDRKNNEPFYERWNVVPCCTRCNTAFGKLATYEEKLIIGETFRQIDHMRKVAAEAALVALGPHIPDPILSA